jgi:segregation and condensation protein A
MEEEGVVELNLKRSEERDPNVQKVGQEQIHELLFGEKLSWQAIIYDLINTEQLDPWDLDISFLSNKYLEKIKELEEHNFFVSSKVLLAAALLLRIKSEILLHQDIPRLDDILFGKKEEKRYIQERIELDDDIPGLVPRTPLPRYRKVTLEELMSALGNAIKTETRRIRKVVIEKQAEMETSFSLPKRRFNLKDKIGEVHDKLKEIFATQDKKLAFSKLLEDDEDKVAIFVPLLHLDTQEKIWLEQDAPFKEIWIWLKDLYEKQNKELLEEMRKEAEGALSEFEDNPEMEKTEIKTEDEEEEEVNEFGFKDRRDKEETEDDTEDK